MYDFSTYPDKKDNCIVYVVIICGTLPLHFTLIIFIDKKFGRQKHLWDKDMEKNK